MVSMTTVYRSWTGQARAMALAVDAAVAAARSHDALAFTDAVADLTPLDREQLAILLGTIMRQLLEQSHPDGLDSESAELVLESCMRAASGWYEPLERTFLIQALTGSLGLFDPDDAPAPSGPAVVIHGVLLIADQLTTLKLDLAPVLDYALGELMRAQTVEMP